VRTLRRLLIALLLVVLAAVGGVAALLRDRPSLDRWARLRLPAASADAPGVRVTHAGVSTLVITDGETTLLTDGFFTRPGLVRTTLGLIAPDEDAIARGLARLGVDRAAAVIVTHSHYDHAMDAPLVAARTGAMLVGSESTANVARGLALPEEQIRVVQPGEVLHFGAFGVQLIASRHYPHGMATGTIDAPLYPPARALDYRQGEVYSVLVTHPAGSLLVQASAGFEPGALAAVRADVVLLGVAGLGRMPGSYHRDYWREVVGVTRPALVIPIHWDDFTRPGSEPLVPMPRVLDDFEATMTFLEARAEVPGAPALGMLPPWKPVVLLPASRLRDGAGDAR
jgi:L-ascorbate metabolism protein UlaG (beta-lactamase superfamily)